MSTALDLLIECHQAGIYLRALSDEELEYEGPEELLTDESVTDLKKHKTELLSLLKWDEEEAYALIRRALAYLAERYVKDSDLLVLSPWEDRIDEAYAREDMGALRVAIMGYVRAGLASFGKSHA
jgi:hypothetical protein